MTLNNIKDLLILNNRELLKRIYNIKNAIVTEVNTALKECVTEDDLRNHDVLSRLSVDDKGSFLFDGQTVEISAPVTDEEIQAAITSTLEMLSTTTESGL